MNKITACFISLYAYPLFDARVLGRIGGAEVQLYYMAQGLAKDDRFKVHLVTGDFNQLHIETHRGITVHSFFNPRGGFRHIRSIWGAYRLMRIMHAINPSVCIVRAPGFEAGVAGIFCVIFHKKLIYMASQHFDPLRARNYGMHFFRWMTLKFLLRTADLILSQHEDQKRQLRDYFGKDSVVRRNAYPVSPSGARALSHKDSVLWVGRCDPWKRPEIFIKLARLFPCVSFVMVCPSSGDESYYALIAKEAALVRNLRHIPHVPFVHMAPYFARAMIFVNTSVSEGFPNTFLQAFDAHAAIASMAADPDGVIERYGLGLCAHDDFTRLTKAMQALLDAHDERMRMGENGNRYLRQYHDLGNIERIDRELVRDAASMKKGKPMIVEFFHYGIGGGIACVINFLSLFLLTEKAGFYYLVSALISYPLAFLTGFVFQAFITFKHREKLVHKMAWFFAHQAVGFGLFMALLYGMTDMLRIHYLVSFFISAGIVYLFNFAFSKIVVFKAHY